MNKLFIAHTPFLLEEFQFGDQGMLRHKTRTEKKTAALESTLRSAGIAARLNPTLWCLRTNFSATQVYERIIAAWNQFGDFDSSGDFFVINVNEFAGHSCDESLHEVLQRFDPNIEPILQKPTSRAKPIPSARVMKKASAEPIKPNGFIYYPTSAKRTDVLRCALPGCYGMGKKR